ncbi:threonine synthase [Natronoglomus mannanivorans]|uniref:Threonine synthase n=1 Tax=Natronoglomus mannanivorans TaxID=2979990 RepID=A0AAP2YZ18_9EURY|nr:threonine synthase [Halobacteria archaeon AArc-xg1-1]
MTTTDAFSGLECVDCEYENKSESESESESGVDGPDETDARRCPDCDGILEATYDLEAIDLDRAELESRPFDSLWRYEELLPFARDSAVTTDEGATALVECSKLADELGVDRVLIKDEGRNPTGSIADRGQSVAVTDALRRDTTDVALASTGNDGQSAAAYAGRADLESHVFVPSRSGFTNKAMVNVHGGDMSVVGGRMGAAEDAYEEALAEHDDWHPLGTFDTPYRLEGAKTLFYEIVEGLEWEVPDAIVVPTGTGLGLAGLYKGAREFRELGLIDEVPALYAAQAAGCAPIVEAFDDGRAEHEPVEHPDTICGDIEIPDPAGGKLALEAIRESDGGAIATEDRAILEAAVAVANGEGLEVAPSPGAAPSAVWDLAERGEFDGSETIVLVNTTAGNKEADVLRSHLMGQGI